MKEERLKQLLEKYYSGDTSLDEERELRDYFSANDIYQGYETEKDILSGYSKSEKTPVPSPGFEQRILMAVDDLEERQVKRILRKRFLPLLSAAATLLLLISSYFLYVYKAEPKDTFSDPQLAYAETVKILNEISLKLNRGTYMLQPITKINSAKQFSKRSIDRSALVISGGLQRIKSLSQLSDAEDNINKKENN